VPKSVFELLEVLGTWTRRWEISRIDAVSAKMLNVELVRKIIERGTQLKGADRGTGTPRDDAALNNLSKLYSVLGVDEKAPVPPTRATSAERTPGADHTPLRRILDRASKGDPKDEGGKGPKGD
jgi:hypothetical protein